MFPFIILVGLAVYAGSRFAHAHNTQVGAELAPVKPKQISPIGVLVEMAKQGIQPPPKVIMCAIAECQVIGRNDLATDIVRLFVAPVVYANAMATRNANPPESPYAQGGGGGMQAPMLAPPAPPAMMLPSPQPAPIMMDYAVAAAQRARQQMQERLAYNNAPRADVAIPEPVPAPAAQPPQQQGAAPIAAPAQRQPTDQELIEEMLRSAGVPVAAKAPPAAPPAPDEAAVVTAGEVALDMRAHRASTPPTPPPSWFMSPIPSVSDMAWTQFTNTLQRQDEAFSGPRHVGAFRARRSRLAELGIDADQLIGSAPAQLHALEQDMRDAHYHVMQSELGDQMHRIIRVPGSDGAHAVSLSGILGVVQCAGLEAAVSWFENARDRERFPHTTQMFLRTNGAF